MNKITSAFLSFLLAGEFQAIAEEPPSSTTNTEGAITQPAAKKTPVMEKKQRAKKHPTNVKNNIFYGGYINLSLGDYMVIGIEPMIGYKVTPKFAAGVKLQYNYIQDDRYANRSYTTSTYGGSIFGRYLLTPKLYAQAELASYNYEYFYLSGGSEREWVPFVFLGGGLIQPLSERTWLNVQIMFDVWQDDSSPYDDWQPFLSIGVGTGF